MAATRNK
ncbi:hypothetical protein AT5G27093, partial [Arabidopsis thaliana]